MRLGLVSDIHSRAAELAAALALFRGRGVDRVVTLGDSCDALGRFDEAGEVAALLEGCGAEGVWGNHDFGLCRGVTAEVRDRYPPAVFEFMARMRPRLVIGDCHFSHKESSDDPLDPFALWDYGEYPLDLMRRATRAFGAADARLQFVGHYHRWWAATPEGPVDWSGDGPQRFEPGRRYFVVVAAARDGRCAVLDTGAGVLEPLHPGRG